MALLTVVLVIFARVYSGAVFFRCLTALSNFRILSIPLPIVMPVLELSGMLLLIS